jgi:protocatechuate 3,4-dioxygenase, beta subunit
VPYPGRTPHIHVAVKKGKKELLVTQLYIAGHPGNEKDGIWLGVKDKKQRDAITVEFAKLKDSKIGELTATFDIVLGKTPEVD